MIIALQPPEQQEGQLPSSGITPVQKCHPRPRDDDACVHIALSRALISCVTRIHRARKPRTPSHAPTLQSEHNNMHTACAPPTVGQSWRSLLLLLLVLSAGADIVVACRIGSISLWLLSPHIANGRSSTNLFSALAGIALQLADTPFPFLLDLYPSRMLFCPLCSRGPIVKHFLSSLSHDIARARSSHWRRRWPRPKCGVLYDRTLLPARVVILFCSISCALSLAHASRGPCSPLAGFLSGQLQ